MDGTPKIPLLLLFFAISTVGWARIGETLEEAEARYGESTAGNALPLLPGSSTYTFARSGLDILVVLLDGKVVAIQYQKSEKNALNKSVELSNTEIETLLKSNDPKNWSVVHRGMAIILRSDDGTLGARFDRMDNTLFIFTEKTNQLLESNKAQKEKENLEGL